MHSYTSVGSEAGSRRGREVSHWGSGRVNKGDYLIVLLCIWSGACCLFGEVRGWMCAEMSRRQLMGTFKLSESSPLPFVFSSKWRQTTTGAKDGEKVYQSLQSVESVSSKYNWVPLFKLRVTRDVTSTSRWCTLRLLFSGPSVTRSLMSLISACMLVNNSLAGCHWK